MLALFCRLCIIGAFVALACVSHDIGRAAAADQSCTLKDAKIARVLVKSRGSETEQLPTEVEAQLGDRIIFEVENLAPALADRECRKKKIILFVNGQPVEDALPIEHSAPTAKGPDQGPATKTKSDAQKAPADATKEASQTRLVFVLRPTKASADSWRPILANPSFDARKIEVGIGFAGEQPIRSGTTLGLVTLPTLWFVAWSVILGLFLIVFFWLAATTAILRDGILTDGVPGEKASFSLAKTQAAVWFFVVLAAYLFIGMVTGDFFASMNATALTLIGIGGGTAMGGVVIDASKQAVHKEEKKAAVDETKTERQELVARQQTAKASGARVASEAVREAEQKLDARERELARDGFSEGFLIDILSDAKGISFHRFQMVVWTVVLSFIFIVEVISSLAMPNFNATLLGLLGLSAGTYLGLKMPEPTVPK